MSITTYHNPAAQLANSRAASQWQCVVGHGAGEIAYTAKHPLIQYIFTTLHIPVVHSMLLPGHGTDTWEHLDTSQQDKIVQHCIDVTDKLIRPLLTRNTLFICYSCSTYFVQKNWLRWQPVIQQNNAQMYAILLGTALGLRNLDESYATTKGTVEVFIERGQADMMKQMHGPHWQNNVRLCAVLTSSQFGSKGAYLTEAERVQLFDTHPNMYFICCDNDITCPPSEAIYPYFTKQQCAQHLVTMPPPVSHFNMLKKSSGWSMTQRYLTAQIIDYVPGLLPYKQPVIDTVTVDRDTRTYVREGYNFQQRGADEWQVVCMHGGGQTRWTHSHPVIKLMMSYVPVVHSLLLPLHEGRNDNIDWDNIVDSSLQLIWKDVEPVIRDRKTIFLAYSVSSLSLLKLWQQFTAIVPDFRFICIGTSLCCPPPTSCQYIFDYWSPASFEQSGIAKQLAKQHGERWQDMAKYVQLVSGVTNSTLWLTDADRNVMLNGKNKDKLYIIQGAHEWAFLPQDCILDVCTQDWISKQVTMIDDCTHFTYFNSQFWPITQRRLRAVMTTAIPESTSTSSKQTQRSSNL